MAQLCRYLLAQPEHPEDAMNNVRVAIGNGLRPDVWEGTLLCWFLSLQRSDSALMSGLMLRKKNPAFKNRFNIGKIAEFCKSAGSIYSGLWWFVILTQQFGCTFRWCHRRCSWLDQLRGAYWCDWFRISISLQHHADAHRTSMCCSLTVPMRASH